VLVESLGELPVHPEPAPAAETIVALVGSLRVCFSFPGSKMKAPLDSPGMLEEPLMHVKLCVFGKVCVNEIYISDRNLDFLWAFFRLHFS